MYFYFYREYNQELWIGNIHKEHEGTFTCMASNRYGTTSTRVYVKVLGRYSLCMWGEWTLMVLDKWSYDNYPSSSFNSFLSKQFGPRSGLTECGSWSGPKLLYTLIVCLKWNCGSAIFIKSMKEHSLTWFPTDMEQHPVEFMLKCLVGTLGMWGEWTCMVQEERVSSEYWVSNFKKTWVSSHWLFLIELSNSK